MHAVFPGDVLGIFDPGVRPPKKKWQICVCGELGLFLRINSNPLFRPNHLIHAADCRALKHDSYVELARLLEFSPVEISEAMESGGYKGRLSPLVRRDLAYAGSKAPTLTPEQKLLIEDRLTREQDVSDEEIWDR